MATSLNQHFRPVMATSPDELRYELRKRAAYMVSLTTDDTTADLLFAAADQLEQQAIEISRLRGNTAQAAIDHAIANRYQCCGAVPPHPHLPHCPITPEWQ